eukprot:TRINITY_DN4571_c4_g1_i1.p1 TRINITY_DN4571_c4_g1~~TRINITY_DN4571_c4_g1_i1.p1  ORF type:complete len:237 (+),score=30.53 TRINITY_DN4571_c4_g1_i1:32-742(+)
MPNIGHVVSGISSVVSLCLLSVVYTDGRSLMSMKERAGYVPGTQTRMFSVTGLGHDYGMGPFQDTYGNEWYDGSDINSYSKLHADTDHISHLVKLMNCNYHGDRGKMVKGTGLAAMVLGVAGIVAHLCALNRAEEKKRELGMLTFLFQILIFICYVVGLGAGASLYDQSFECNYEGQTVEMTFSDFFDLGPAIPVYAIGAILTLGNLVVMCSSGAVTDGSEAAFKKDKKKKNKSSK